MKTNYTEAEAMKFHDCLLNTLDLLIEFEHKNGVKLRDFKSNFFL